MWAAAWYQMNKGRCLKGPRQIAEFVLNIRELLPAETELRDCMTLTTYANAVILITGFFFFGAGTYASVQSIINSCECSRQNSYTAERCLTR